MDIRKRRLSAKSRRLSSSKRSIVFLLFSVSLPDIEISKVDTPDIGGRSVQRLAKSVALRSAYLSSSHAIMKK